MQEGLFATGLLLPQLWASLSLASVFPRMVTLEALQGGEVSSVLCFNAWELLQHRPAAATQQNDHAEAQQAECGWLWDNKCLFGK